MPRVEQLSRDVSSGCLPARQEWPTEATAGQSWGDIMEVHPSGLLDTFLFIYHVIICSFLDTVSYRAGWPGTQPTTKDGLEFPPASTFLFSVNTMN